MNRFLTKAGLGVALAATALTAAAPADAQRWGGGWHGGGGWHRGGGGGDVAAGALLGGVVGLGIGAAIASNNNGRYYDRGYYDRGYYPPPPPPRAYYYDDDYYYRPAPRCWQSWRWDPYWGRNVPVRVCR